MMTEVSCAIVGGLPAGIHVSSRPVRRKPARHIRYAEVVGSNPLSRPERCWSEDCRQASGHHLDFFGRMAGERGSCRIDCPLSWAAMRFSSTGDLLGQFVVVSSAIGLAGVAVGTDQSSPQLDSVIIAGDLPLSRRPRSGQWLVPAAVGFCPVTPVPRRLLPGWIS